MSVDLLGSEYADLIVTLVMYCQGVGYLLGSPTIGRLCVYTLYHVHIIRRKVGTGGGGGSVAPPLGKNKVVTRKRNKNGAFS